MMFSNSVRISVVVVALLMSCGAIAQEQAGAPIATIESNDLETLELFLDWSSIRTSVRQSFGDQGMEMPDGLDEWLSRIRGRMTIEEHMIVVRPEGADRREAQNLIDELFHVFRNSVFRQHSLQRLNQQLQQLENEISESRSALREAMGEWREPEHIAQEYHEAKEHLYELDLNSARLRARMQTIQKHIEQRIEEHKNLAERRAAAVEMRIHALREALEAHHVEMEEKRMLLEKEFITEEELEDQELHLLAQERELAEHMEHLELLRLGQGNDAIRDLKDVLIDSESELAVMLATRELVEQRLAELQQKLQMAGEQTRHQNELHVHVGKLSNAHALLIGGDALPLFPVEGLPQLRLRWVN